MSGRQHGPEDNGTPIAGEPAPVEGNPDVDDVAPIWVEDVAPIWHGAVETGAEGLMVRASGGGLRPPGPSSVEPSGIPTRPTGPDEAIPVGEEADAAGRDEAAAVAVAVQVPDALPAMPPPSKLDIPALDVPMADGAAVPKHAVGTSLGAIGDAPDARGLMPGNAISVAPSGMPVGATGEPGPIPSGEVASSGGIESVPVIWENAALQPKSAASIAAINARPIIGSL